MKLVSRATSLQDAVSEKIQEMDRFENKVGKGTAAPIKPTSRYLHSSQSCAAAEDHF